MDSRLEALLPLVEAAVRERAPNADRQRGDEMIFRCPNGAAHKNGDANPSARYNRAKGAWTCPVCGEGGGLLDLARRLGVEVPEAAPEDGRPAGVPPTWTDKKTGGRLRYRHAWPYHDAIGAVIGWVIRYDDGAGVKNVIPFFKREGERWKNGYAAPKGSRPLFHLHKLAQAEPDALAYVVEGEKAADALDALGVLVTTSPGGAQAAAWADWSPLAGRRVILWRDHDEPGRAYMADVLRLLRGLRGAP